MDALLLSRIQFAVTVAFHYIYPPFSIGLGLFLVLAEAMYLKTKKPVYEAISRFWVAVFGLIFVIGVATGIVLEFEFGTNWAAYSRFVGDVFGSPLAAEGIFAFFLESVFLGVLLFGRNRVGRKFYFFSTLMVALGATLSAFWIVAANSWMHTPAGHHVVNSTFGPRAEIVDFWAMVFNPSTMDRFIHVVIGCWQAGIWLVLSVSAYYVLKNKHLEFAKTSIRIGLVVAVVASVLQLISGHASAIGVSKNQPVKFAAFEAHYEKLAPAPFRFFGWVDEKNEKVKYSVGLPGGLSFLTHFDFNKPIPGLTAVPKELQTPVNPVFQTYHIMVMVGFALIGLSFLGLFLWWRGKLFETRWVLWLFVFAVLGPQIANQTGWAATEIGRQPWVVQGLLFTRDAFSANVNAWEVLASLVMFVLIYVLLFVLFLYLLIQKINKGPVE